MDIQVGEYVKTKTGKIAKVETINSVRYTHWSAKTRGKIELVGTKRILINGKYELEDIIKHSKNIIDLIEIGDYVNGRKVKHIAMFEGFPDYPKLIFVDEKHLLPGETAENKDIKTVVTKEQYASMEYKLEEQCYS